MTDRRCLLRTAGNTASSCSAQTHAAFRASARTRHRRRCTAPTADRQCAGTTPHGQRNDRSAACGLLLATVRGRCPPIASRAGIGRRKDHHGDRAARRGSASDIIARVVMEQVGQAARPDRRGREPAGAGGTIGANMVAKSAPDGYTILVYGALTSAHALYSKLPYDSLQRFHAGDVARPAAAGDRERARQGLQDAAAI